LDFLAQCRQIKTNGREALFAHHEECRRYWAENMRNGRSLPAHLSSSTAFALKKDFSHHREEAELNNELIDHRHYDKASRAMAIDGEGLRLMTEEH
jgi:DNA-binding IclR family transcriptional regulator